MFGYGNEIIEDAALNTSKGNNNNINRQVRKIIGGIEVPSRKANNKKYHLQ